MSDQNSRTRGLIPFQKGQSGNPGGRRPGLSLTRLVRNEMEKPSKENPAKTNGDIVAEKVVELAKQGNAVFTPLVWRYVDGDPKAAAELTLKELAEQLAERMGLDAKELLAQFERDLGAA